jgi:polyisoprenoid-binding protein YceI
MCIPIRLLERNILLAALCLLPVFGSSALAESINLPLDPKGSSLKFVGDSFLHSFHGEARDFTGAAQLDSSATPPVQSATLHFRTAALTTFHNGRDQKMREWLKVTAHPDATFTLESVKLIEGDIQKADPQHPARFNVSGTFDLNGVKQPIGGTALGWRERDRLIVSGETTIDTLKHGLPQIREAFMTVGTNVKTTYRFSFTLPAEFALK